MEFVTRSLIQDDVDAAVKLDSMWFGKYGISREDLSNYVKYNPSGGLTLLTNNNFEGFVTFEILENKSPTDYDGDVPNVSKVLFIQQFTTSTNYSKNNMHMDSELIGEVERLAKKLGCIEVWEALATTHPYSSAINSNFDAFGFYTSNGYIFDENNLLSWKPNNSVSIPCYLFRKKLS